jgi:ethanolamine utilization protein EutQ
MSTVLQFKKSDRKFDPYGEDAAKASISRLVGPEISNSMGAGVAKFDNCSIEWTVLYDELIVTFEGRFRLRTGAATYECTPGDVL